ncbi:hypothetical protein PoB_004533400 [Plakobranchus ocellatus]|uniref:Uncharacterized protein n=1 Tax=Plakobranchus ocellatus TaxID=259542 RepID=A0AAV4BFH1_9GAST|nr:hypothetical protein PoB_004533400 [Plakobranchus ocellatus]
MNAPQLSAKGKNDQIWELKNVQIVKNMPPVSKPVQAWNKLGVKSQDPHRLSIHRQHFNRFTIQYSSTGNKICNLVLRFEIACNLTANVFRLQYATELPLKLSARVNYYCTTNASQVELQKRRRRQRRRRRRKKKAKRKKKKLKLKVAGDRRLFYNI